VRFLIFSNFLSVRNYGSNRTAPGETNMAPSPEPNQPADLRDYLAAERTLLAWIRTGLALMGFGFVVARFGLFLQEVRIAQFPLSPQSYGLSLWFGTALIAVGVALNLFAAWQHAQLVRALNRGASAPGRSSAPAIALAVFLALIGCAMAIYLISLRSAARTSSENNSQDIQEVRMSLSTDNGIVTKPANQSVDETVEKLKAILQAKGVALFALVDHSGEAEKVGMNMPPTKLLIFGNPKAGTPLMLAAPSSAIDLPLKILVSEDAAGKVWLSYNSPAYLQQRHGIPEHFMPVIAVVDALASNAGA
jgi:uncharacterized protein (DUF302 family)/uncharacterized membrane protein YidH (DUF202 family)